VVEDGFRVFPDERTGLLFEGDAMDGAYASGASRCCKIAF
jgi:hypothetical protein